MIDVIARGLALKSGAALVRQAQAARIARLLSRAASRNPVDLAEGGAGLATITPKAAASGTSGLTQVIDQTSHPGWFSWLGGTRTYAGAGLNGWYAPVVTRRSGGNAGGGLQDTLAARMAFMTDATSMDLFYLTFAGEQYRVLIDGQYVGKTVRTDASNAGGYNRLNIALADTTRKLRRIDLEMNYTSCVGGNGGAQATIAIGPNDTIAPIDTSDTLRVAVVGDSVTAGTGADFLWNAYAPMLGYLLGGIDVDLRQIALGGTGYVVDNSQYNFQGHVSDLAQASFDLVIFAGGINDAAQAPAAVQAAALALFDAARVLQPDAVFVVLGSWCASTGPTAQNLATEAAIQAAAAQFDDPACVFVPVCTDPTGPWINATNGPVLNQTGATGGGSPDGTHPGNVGHLYLARRANTAIRTALLSIGF